MYLYPLLLQKRELHQLRGKLKNIVDKREIVFRERRLLTDRVDSIVKNIGEEIEARKKVSGSCCWAKFPNAGFTQPLFTNQRCARS